MVETKVQHPKMFAALAGGLALVAAVAMIGPRNSDLFGATGATADETPVQTTVDDGVVFTAPGELVELFEPPETSTDVTTAGSATPTTITPAPAPAPATSPTQPPPSIATTASTSPDQATDATSSTSTQPNTPGDTGEGDEPDPGAQLGEPTSSSSIGENASVTASDQALQAGARLLAAPELSGTARGSTVSAPQLIAQVGTRDVNSVPWMLLIAANFGVTVSALVLLRLRR